MKHWLIASLTRTPILELLERTKQQQDEHKAKNRRDEIFTEVRTLQNTSERTDKIIHIDGLRCRLLTCM